MSLEQFRTDEEESVRKVGQIVELIVTSQQQIQDAHGAIGDEAPRRQERWSALEQSFDEFIHELQSLATEFSSVLDSEGGDMAAEIEQDVVRLETAAEGVCDAAARVRQAAGEAHAGLDAIEHQVGDHLQQLVTVADEWSATCEQSDGELQQALVELTGQITAVTEELEQTQDQLEAECEELGSSLTETHAAALEENFGSLADAVQEELVDGLAGDFDSVGQQVQELLSEFDGDIGELADDLEARAGQLLNDLGETAKEELESSIKESVEELVEEAVKGFTAEIVENIVMTNLGVTTTSTLSPILPELAAAKKLLELVNQATNLF